MEENRIGSMRAISDGQSVSDVALSLAREVLAKAKEQGVAPENVAELYGAAFIGAAITSVSALASRDASNCVSALNQILRVASALGFQFGVTAKPDDEPVIFQPVDEGARRDN